MKILVVGSHQIGAAKLGADRAFDSSTIATLLDTFEPQTVVHMARQTPFETLIHNVCEANGWSEELIKPTALQSAVSSVDGVAVFVRGPGPATEWANQMEDMGVDVVEFKV